MPTASKTYLIAGATRGIGRGLVASLLQRDGSTVIAGVRDPEAATARSLDGLPKGKGSKLIVVGIDAESDTSAGLAISTLQSTHSITSIDVVIANAGKTQDFTPMASLGLSLARELFEINTLGPLRLFQAVLPLLKPGARFLVMSSAAGSITGALQMPFGVGAYGMSKASVNFVVAKASQEHPDLAITALHPGMVATDMTRKAIEETKIPGISVEESVGGLLKLMEKPREEVSGKFLDWQGEVLPW